MNESLELSTSTQLSINNLANLAVLQYPSPATRRVYSAHLRRFLGSGYPLTRAGVLEWLQEARKGQGIDSDKPSGSNRATVVNQAIRAIRALTDEAYLRQLIPEVEYRAIKSIRYDKEKGVRQGRWLSIDEAKLLYSLPDRNTVPGQRDSAILALLLGCGLRRDEALSVKWGHYRMRDGRMCLVDLMGKGGKVRTVPVMAGAKVDLDRWQRTLAAEGGARMVEDSMPVIVGLPTRAHLQQINAYGKRDVSEHGKWRFREIGASGLWKVVQGYAERMGVEGFSPHDLRRTLAKLMHKAGVELSQISATLGHSNLVTTQRYLGLGVELEEGKAGVDKVQL